MTDRNTVSSSLATLTANGWVTADPLIGQFGEALRKPSGFTFDWDRYFPWDIRIGPDGRAHHNFDPLQFYPTPGNPFFDGWSNYYLDNVGGNNANDGSTYALRKQSWSSLVTAINTAAVPAIVWVKYTGTDYIRAHGWNGGTRLAVPVCVIGYGGPGRVVMGLHDNATWGVDGTYTNTFSTTTFTTFKRGVDLLNLDDLGDYTEFTEVATPDEVEAVTTTGAAGGVICQSGGKIYVRRYDGVTPSNTNTRVYRGSVEGARNPTSGDCLVWNMAFEGGNTAAFKADGNASGRVFWFNSSFKWGGANEYQSVITPTSAVDSVAVRDVAFALAYNCVAAHAGTDGWDWTPTAGTTPHGVLIDSGGYRNGQRGNGSNNGVTCHEGSKLLILNGDYAENYGGNIALADTGGLGTQALLVGTVLRRSRGDVVIGGTIDPANAQVFSASQLWLDTVVSDTDQTNADDRDMSASGTGRISYRNLKVNNRIRQAVAGSAQITTYA